ncbi:MAG: hypothetical protein AB7I37_27330 [Pirellulales bacterium]
MTMLSLRTMVRMAVRLQSRLPPSTEFPDFSPAIAAWQQLLQANARLEFVRQRAWPTAQLSVTSEVARAASLVRLRLEDELNICKAIKPARATATLRDVLADLQALGREFPELRIDLRLNQLSVVTEPINLEEVPLGRFEIVVRCDQLDEYRAYHVMALDPSPAASNSDTIHPHVQDGILCEGEGHHAIRAALSQGRLWDFFVLVRQVLQTYNGSSAFVSLERWHGSDCGDCGDLMSDDDITSCERCDSQICLDCSASCEDCGHSYCSECRGLCHNCDQYVCMACSRACTGCDHHFCQSCLQAGRCAACVEDLPPENSPDEHQDLASPEAPPPADAAIQPLRLGEVAVPA